jgi:flagellin
MVSLPTNVSAMNSARLLNITNNSLARTTERLSSQLRINRASDDPAGLFMSESLTADIRGSQAAIGNINQASAVAEIADQTMASLADIVQRMHELAVAANSDLLAVGSGARIALDAEYQALDDAYTDIINNTEFNGTDVFGGTFSDVQLQVGAAATSVSTLDIDSPGAAPGGDLLSVANAAAAVTATDTAMTNISTERAQVGAQISGLVHQRAVLETAVVTHSEARRQIRDADIAAEVTNLVSAQIRQQAGASALSAANFSAQFVLSLLQ